MEVIVYFSFLDYDKKPIVLLTPDVRVQTELKRRKSPSHSDLRKKSLIDTGIELLFKKSIRNVKDDGGLAQTSIAHPLSSDFKFSTETTNASGSCIDRDSLNQSEDHYRWNLFDTIKIHTDKRRLNDSNG